MKKFVDDGRTIFSMDNVGSPEQHKRNGKADDSKNNEKRERIVLSRKEKWAAIRAGFEVYAPVLLIVVACFAFVAVMMYLWLK